MLLKTQFPETEITITQPVTFTQPVTIASLKIGIEDLELRYLMFCEKHGLNENLKPDEQYDLNSNQQLYIDNHLNKFTSLKVQILTKTKEFEADTSTATIVIASSNGNNIDMKDDSISGVNTHLEAMSKIQDEKQLGFDLLQ